MKYLLDTDICIYLIKQKPASVIEKLAQVNTSDVALSTISVYELQYGVENSQHQDQSQRALNHFLESFANILPVDRPVAGHAAKLRAALKKKGTPINPYDVLIAAVAMSHQLIMVTNNVGEFMRVEGLVVENWANAG